MVKKKKKIIKKEKGVSIHDRILSTRKKHAGGRPLKSEKLDKNLIGDMLELGLTDVQISSILDIDESTLHRWKKREVEFCKSLKNWKRFADENVERSLYQRACGFHNNEDKVHFFEGKFHTLRIKKYYPPSEVACFFWLANRQPDIWKHKPQGNPDFEKLIPVVNHLADVIKKKVKGK